MISGQGLIGKLALFVAEKLISHQLAIALDEKKRVCRAFVELYHCLDRMEELNARFVATLSHGVEHGGILIGDLEILLPAVNGVSQRFLELQGELYYALELLDPILSESVHQLYAAKDSFLFLVANAIRYKEPMRDVRLVEYDEPSPRILEIDMDAFYEWTKTSSKESTYNRDKFEWPANLLRFGEFEAGFHSSQIVLDSRESLDRFRTVLIDHGAVLSAARAKMREFIVSKFAVEDILYVSKGMERNEF